MKFGKIAVLGDSYSTFEGYIPNGYSCYYPRPDVPELRVDSVEKTWWKPLTEREGSELLVNCSYSGSTVCYTSYDGVIRAETSFLERAKEYFCGKYRPDTLFVFGGTNDTWAGSPIGELPPEGAEIGAEDCKKVLPATAALFRLLRKENPDMRIVALLNPILKPEIADAITTECHRVGGDMIAFSELDCEGGHPTDRGMQTIRDGILKFYGE